MSTDITIDIQAMITHHATDAWNRHDADAYVKDMDDGCVWTDIAAQNARWAPPRSDPTSPKSWLLGAT